MRRGDGTHYDPKLLAHFLANISEISRIAQEHPDVFDGEAAMPPFAAPPWTGQFRLDPTDSWGQPWTTS
jgi:hypothetical protein